MSKFIEVLTLLSIVTVVISAMAKLNHWYGAALLMPIGIFALTFLMVRFIVNMLRLLKRHS